MSEKKLHRGTGKKAEAPIEKEEEEEAYDESENGWILVEKNPMDHRRVRRDGRNRRKRSTVEEYIHYSEVNLLRFLSVIGYRF